MGLDVIGNLLSEYVKGIIILDIQQTVVWRNNIYKDITGGEDIIGKSFSEIFSLELRNISNNNIIKNISGKKYSIRY